MKVHYYYLLASQEFLMEKEPLEEVLRERIQYYEKIGKPVDFWLLPNPGFLKGPSFVSLQEKLPSPSLALVSTNRLFVQWLKLRLNHVWMGDFLSPSAEILHPLDFEPV